MKKKNKIKYRFDVICPISKKVVSFYSIEKARAYQKSQTDLGFIETIKL